MHTFVLDLAVAISIDYLDDLLHHVVRIFHGYGHEYQQPGLGSEIRMEC